MSKDTALFVVGCLSVMRFFPAGEAPRAQLTSMILKNLKPVDIEEFITKMVEQGDWQGSEQLLNTIEAVNAKYNKTPDPLCQKCSGCGWVTVFRAGLSGAARCDCWSRNNPKQLTGTPAPLSPEEIAFTEGLIRTLARRVPTPKPPPIPARPLRSQAETDLVIQNLEAQLAERRG